MPLLNSSAHCCCMPAEPLLINVRAKQSAASGALQHPRPHRAVQTPPRQRLPLPQRRHSTPLHPAAAAVTAARAAWAPCCCSQQRSLQVWAAGSLHGVLRSSSSWTTGSQRCGCETAAVCITAVSAADCCKVGALSQPAVLRRLHPVTSLQQLSGSRSSHQWRLRGSLTRPTPSS